MGKAASSSESRWVGELTGRDAGIRKKEKQKGGVRDGEKRVQVSLMDCLSVLLDHQPSLAAAQEPHTHTHPFHIPLSISLPPSTFSIAQAHSL